MHPAPQPRRLNRPVFNRRAILSGGGAAFVLHAAPIAAAERIKIRDLWGDGGAFSQLAESLNGAVIELRGYMAPPLKPEVTFFVLTRIPMAVCPFCDSEASWPMDLVVVEAARVIAPVPFNDLIRVTGRLELGAKSDAATGFVSRVRLVEADFAIA